jgi:UDP:flavonoid glycosyltransferase YjiC (YdhE family)
LFALAHTLIRRGYDVTIAAAGRYRPIVHALGARYLDFADEAEREGRKALIGLRGRLSPGGQRDFVFRRHVAPLLPALAEKVRQIAVGYDLVVVTEMLALLADAPPAGARLVFAVISQPAGGLSRALVGRPFLKLVASTAALHDVRAIPPDFVLTDFWRLPTGLFAPPDGLAEFLARGPTIAVALGSTGELLPATTELWTEAAAGAGVRVLLQDTTASGVAQHGHALTVGEVPYGWLFPRVAAVIHHGGANTTGDVLAAGRPSVALPQFGDQFYWAHRLQLLGLSSGMLAPSEVRVARLTALIRRAKMDEALAGRCRVFAASCSPADGVDVAARYIEAELR